jgi:hypothetical protein
MAKKGIDVFRQVSTQFKYLMSIRFSGSWEAKIRGDRLLALK